MMNDYRRSWALRYMREAKDELKISQKTSEPIDLIMDAARKAQAAIYYGMGDPSYIESIVNGVAEETSFVENPILRCLVEIERTLQRMESLPVSASEEALTEADEIVRVASKIVDLLTSKD